MSDRYQREIEEILEKVNDDLEQSVVTKYSRRKPSPVSRVMPKTSRSQSPTRRTSSDARKWMLIGLLGLVLGVFLNGMGLMVAPFVLWGSILLLGTSYAIYFIGKSRRVEKRWRGEVIDDSIVKGPGNLADLWRRFRR